MSVAVEMPKYRCHKEVWALKIKSVDRKPLPEWKEPVCCGSFALKSACGQCERCKYFQEHGEQQIFVITPEEPRYAPFEVDGKYIDQHKPEAGGYYVVYKGGYKSYSPADAFEEGYTLLN